MTILSLMVVIPLIKALKHHVLDTELQRNHSTLQLWCSYDSTLSSTFTRIKYWFAELCRVKPTIGYHPEISQILMITSPLTNSG